MGAFEYYRQKLIELPRLTNGLASLFISCFADCVAQMMERFNTGGSHPGYSLARTRALGVTSGVYMGLLYTSWLHLMFKHFPLPNCKSIVMKLIVTQCFFQPFVYLPYFFVFHGVMMGQSWDEIMKVFSAEYVPVLLRLWALTVPTRIIMFACIPLRYQVLYDSLVSFFWQVALSLFDSEHDHPATQGFISAVMETDRFGYLNPRPAGTRYLPPDFSMEPL